MSSFLHISESNLSKLDKKAGWIKGSMMWSQISPKYYQTGLAVCREGDWLRVNQIAISPINQYTDFKIYRIQEGAGVTNTSIKREDVIAILPADNIL